MPELPPPGPGRASCAARDAEIAEPRAQLAALGERVARMERAASRDSGNSSMPPSSDDLQGRRPPGKQRRASERAEKRRSGKQPGAPGSAMCWAEPDETRDHYPQGTCACGADLGGALDLGVAT